MHCCLLWCWALELLCGGQQEELLGYDDVVYLIRSVGQPSDISFYRTDIHVEKKKKKNCDLYYVVILLCSVDLSYYHMINIEGGKKKKKKMSFPIYIRHLDGETKSFNIQVGCDVETVKNLLEEENASFDLLHAGELLCESDLEPNVELDMVVNRLYLAEKRVESLIYYEGSGYWEQGHALPDNQQSQVGCGCVEFPSPTDININMMPFIFGDDTTIPEQYRGYIPLIYNCWNVTNGSICYLTIEESLVKSGLSQRRPGLHIETPGNIQNIHPKHRLGGGSNPRLCWGEGYMQDHCYDGIYMASSVSDSCKLYNVVIRNEELTKSGVIGQHGDVSHISHEINLACKKRDELVEDYRSYCETDSIIVTKSNKLYWLTDRTPHESLPLKEDTYRQFFRLVTQNISVWFEDHSTANPLGIKPPPEVIILKGDKFVE